jgi:hypothetical protein
MKASIGQLYDGVLTGTITKLNTQKYSNAKVGYKMGRVLKSALAEYEEADKQRVELLKEYASLPEGAVAYVFEEPSKKDEFEEKWKGVRELEVEIWGDPFSPDDLQGQVELSAAEFSIMDWMIEEPAEPLKLVKETA